MARDLYNESQEDYLEGIYMVTQKCGFCRSVDLAEELGFTKPSVSVAVAKMKSENLVKVGHAGILELTEEGRRIAENTLKKHVFLKHILCRIGVEEATAEQEACRMEHIISDDTFQKLMIAAGTL